MDGTTALLNERKKTHGEYADDARCAMNLMTIVEVELDFRHDRGQPTLSCPQQHSLHMIMFKIARIITGDANFRDHWDDIAGYAKLVSDRIIDPNPVPEQADPRQLEPPLDPEHQTDGSDCWCEPVREDYSDTGCADDCVHPSHRPPTVPCTCKQTGIPCMAAAGNELKYVTCCAKEARNGRPGRRADEEEPANGADALGWNNKSPCLCRDLDRCRVDEGVGIGSHRFCRKAEADAVPEVYSRKAESP